MYFVTDQDDQILLRGVLLSALNGLVEERHLARQALADRLGSLLPLMQECGELAPWIEEGQGLLRQIRTPGWEGRLPLEHWAQCLAQCLNVSRFGPDYGPAYLQ